MCCMICVSVSIHFKPLRQRHFRRMTLRRAQQYLRRGVQIHDARLRIEYDDAKLQRIQIRCVWIAYSSVIVLRECGSIHV